MSTPIASLPPAETRLLPQVGPIDPDADVAGVLREIVEMVEKCDFVKIYRASEPDTPIRVVDRETGVSEVVPSNQLVADWGLLRSIRWGMVNEESSDEEEWSISSVSSYDSDSPTVAGADLGERVCNRCHHGEAVIESRGFGWEDWLATTDLGFGAALICRSCAVGDNNFYCTDCGYSEVLCKQYHGEQLGQFYLEGQTRPEYQDERTRCQGCRARVERYEREEREEREEGEGAPVNRVLFPENDDEEAPDYSLIAEEWAETYEGELEPGEEEEDNNGENVALEEALGRTEVEMFGPMGPGRHGSHIDRIECLETICGIVVLDAQNDRLMERLRTVVNILGIDVPGIYSLGDEEDPYDGELDLEEETEDNNEEKALRVKKTVQEMGELLFDIKDKISEGEYLKLMDGLQSITNEMNQ